MSAPQGTLPESSPTPERPRRAPTGSVIMVIAVAAALTALVVVAMRGPARPGTMAERVREVAATLRCPVCQNLTVADSPSRLAQEMRATIARDLAAGRTPDAIRAGFVEAYGTWILESPPKAGLDLVAWVAPFLLLVGGAGVAAMAIRRWTGGRREADPAGTLSPTDRARLDRALAAGEDDSG